MDYEWDAAKAAENRHRHGIDFADSIAAIEDPNRLEEIDDRFEYGEERIRVIGMADGNVLFVVTTLRDERTCRIISARRATRYEQDRYYADDHEAW
ncbi:MAG TPA: BrnT family toxin [Thermoanaerobaculia bacterium]